VGDWALAANLARCVVCVVFGTMLLVLMVSRRWGGRVVALAPQILIAVAILSTVALRQVPYSGNYTFAGTIAIMTGITAIMLMAALFAAVYYDGLDQLLWLALAAYALKETLAVSFLPVVAGSSLYWIVFYWMALALTVCMAGLAARRLQLAVGGRRVPAAFEAVHALRRPAHG
jgi:hypothetical protein